jgi:hypothetical protein
LGGAQWRGRIGGGRQGLSRLGYFRERQFYYAGENILWKSPKCLIKHDWQILVSRPCDWIPASPGNPCRGRLCWNDGIKELSKISKLARNICE